MHTSRKLLTAGLLAIGLAACARSEAPVLSVDASDLAPSVLLTTVPFHPQAERSDCGPAALAMMLGWSGIDTNPIKLAPSVYTPGREGTLQSDIVQASRRAGRLALQVRSLRDVLAELDAGNPVLVLQNLGLARWPIWHYAVAMGYDLERATLFLHSGREARHTMDFHDFAASWTSSKNWALTITRPDQLPATLDQVRGLEAANGLEQADRDGAAATAYGALLGRWPDSLPALMGFGNARHAAGDIAAARKTFRHAVTLDPKAAEAWNNLAVSLADEGKHEEALQAAKEAVRLGGPNKAAAEETLAELEIGAP